MGDRTFNRRNIELAAGEHSDPIDQDKRRIRATDDERFDLWVMRHLGAEEVDVLEPNRRSEPVSQAPLPGSERDFVVNIGDRVYFDYDKYAVRSDAGPLLDAQSSWLKRFPAVQVRIEGNCDERGTQEYNLALGARRANAIREYLVAHGVGAGRITTVSFGKEKPIDPGTGEAADQHNRNTRTAIVSGARMQ